MNILIGIHIKLYRWVFISLMKFMHTKKSPHLYVHFRSIVSWFFLFIFCLFLVIKSRSDYFFLLYYYNWLFLRGKSNHTAYITNTNTGQLAKHSKSKQSGFLPNKRNNQNTQNRVQHDTEVMWSHSREFQRTVSGYFSNYSTIHTELMRIFTFKYHQG